MKITLNVTKIAGQAPAQPMSMSFDQLGGRIGRKANNDWVLPDPERFISGHHAQIGFYNGTFFLVDTSSNGVFLNGATTPVGKNNQVTLEDDDTIIIGEYEIHISLQVPQTQAALSSDFEGLDDPFAQLTDEHAGHKLDQVVDTLVDEHQQIPEESDYQFEEPSPSHLILDTPPADTPEGVASELGYTSDLNAAFNQPTPIPEDWDLDNHAAEATPPSENKAGATSQISSSLDNSAIQASPSTHWEEETPKPHSPQPAIPRPGQGIYSTPSSPAPRAEAVPPSTTNETELRRALAEGLAIPTAYFDSLPLTDLARNIGQVLRASVVGNMSLLRARSQIKGEFRMSQTMIKPVENNPLKFSINIDEALHHIINPSPGSGYLPPLVAVEEAHEDIEAHMMAVMVGMQAALKVVLQRFKPEILEKRLGQSALLEKLPIYRHAKTWDLFTELYQEIANEAEDDFHQLFGRAFAQAYEDQIRRLESLKHANPEG
jgi:type VI secretion system protein